MEKATGGSALRRFCVVALSALLFTLAGCAENNTSMFRPAGPAAERISSLWWLMFWLGLLVYVAVMGYLLLALFRGRAQADSGDPPEGSKVVLWAGGIIPTLILVGVFGATVYTMDALEEPAIPEELTIEVVGQQWWWQVNYHELGFTTANEIHIPAGQPVRFHLTSEDVIHSFWVPQLQGKLDLIPGDVTTFWLEADEPGVYKGVCAEFCGIQHTKMQFLIIAEEPEAFAEWVALQQQPAPAPADMAAEQGLQVFLDSDCFLCHQIEGTNATGELGPDLTHLASRRTIAAGTAANTPGNLAGWISDPQSMKPGALMPPSELTGPELQALLAYLATLE